MMYTGRALVFSQYRGMATRAETFARQKHAVNSRYFESQGEEEKEEFFKKNY